MLLVLLLGCRAHLSFDTPIPDDGTFARAEPSADALARYEAAAAYSEANDGRAMMVLEGMNVVFEAEQNGHLASEPNHIFSGTKTFACLAAAFATTEGLATLETPVSRDIPEWAQDPDKAPITTGHLLHFTSGLQDDFFTLTWDGLLAEPRELDKYQFALDQPSVSEAGTAYDYGSVHLTAYAAWLQASSGLDVLAWLEPRLFTPLTFRYAGWHGEAEGEPMLAYGAWTTANEWAKVGVLLRDDGAWQGEPILPAGALDPCFEGSDPMPAYGLGVWLNAELTAEQAKLVPNEGVSAGRMLPSAPADLFMAAGAQDNRLFVIPSLDLVVVRMSNGGGDWIDDEFLALLLP